jgi:3-oxoacyl-[acyl-carrier protein] reductase
MNKDLYDLSGKVALVTGGSRGIGRAIALALAEGGADILLNYSRSDKQADEVKRGIEAIGRKCVTVRADVSKFEQAQNLGKAVVNHFGGKVDILINNAGVNRDRTLRRMTSEQWNEVIQTNLTSLFNCTKAVIELMVAQNGGVIVSVSSIIGEMGNIGQANYAATKAGIIGFTKTMAKELAGNNIRVNAIAPGFIETDMLGTVPEDIRKQIRAQIPLGRFGTPEEIALAVLYLCSPAASWITGITLRINGGHYI